MQKNVTKIRNCEIVKCQKVFLKYLFSTFHSKGEGVLKIFSPNAKHILELLKTRILGAGHEQFRLKRPVKNELSERFLHFGCIFDIPSSVYSAFLLPHKIWRMYKLFRFLMIAASVHLVFLSGHNKYTGDL